MANREQRRALEKNGATVKQVGLHASQYKGPVPSPEMMESFKAVSPDLPDRIMKLAENADRRRTMEIEIQAKQVENQRLAIKGANLSTILGQVFTFVLALVLFALTIALVLYGQLTAALVSGIPVVAWFIVVTIFRNFGNSEKKK